MKLVHWKSRCYYEFVSRIHQTNVTYSSATRCCCFNCWLWHFWNWGCYNMMVTWFRLFNFWSNQMAFSFEVSRNLSKRILIGQLKLSILKLNKFIIFKLLFTVSWLQKYKYIGHPIYFMVSEKKKNTYPTFLLDQL